MGLWSNGTLAPLDIGPIGLWPHGKLAPWEIDHFWLMLAPVSPFLAPFDLFWLLSAPFGL